jgi:hypothetical protein
MNQLHQGHRLQKRQYLLFPMFVDSQTRAQEDSSLYQVVQPMALIAPKIVQISLQMIRKEILYSKFYNSTRYK